MPKRFLIYLLFALSGISGVIYEVIWARSFRSVFGSVTLSASAVLSAYFLGLAVGYVLGGRLSRSRRPIRLYGWTEIAIGLTALLVAPWISFFLSIYPDVHQWVGGQPVLLTICRLLLSLIALGPPTVAMGITLPLIARALVDTTEHVASRAGFGYAVNLLGATVGALLAGVILPPWIGVYSSVLLAVGINLSVGVVALCASRTDGAAEQKSHQQLPDVNESSHSMPGVLPIAFAAVSGFGTLSLQVLYVRILSQRSEASVYSFSLMLVIFLLFLALGSLFVSWRLNRTQLGRFLGWTQLAAVVLILLTPLLFEVVHLATSETRFFTRTLLVAFTSAAALGPTVFLVGVVLPTTWKMATSQPSNVGRHVGLLSAANTLTGVVGAVGTGFLLLPIFGLSGALMVVAGLYAVLALVGLWIGYQGLSRVAAIVGGIAMFGGVCWLGVWRWNFHPLGEGSELLHYRDGATATVSVVHAPQGNRSLWVNHRYVLGDTISAPREIRQGRLPMVLHPQPRRVALIGVATGLTCSGCLDLPTERLVGIEIVPDVIDALPYFKRWNRSFFKDPRVQLLKADGRNHLLATRETFDVIISDLFVPWHAGAGDLYTVEHFRTCHQRLAAGGIFVQWIPGWQLSVEELRVITRSVQEAFPHVTFWRGNFDPSQPLLALIAYRDGAQIDADSVRSACRRLSETPGPPASFLGNPAGLQMLYLSGDSELRQWARDAPLNTDNHPYIEYSAPQSLLQHRQVETDPMLQFLAKFRPRRWCFSEQVTEDISLDLTFRAADLLHDANVARLKNNSVLEFSHLRQLVELAGNVPGVAEHVVFAAARYRSRNLSHRSDELLSALAPHPNAPVAALLALAEARRLDGNADEAIQLMGRAVEQAPHLKAVRKQLVELLEYAEQFTQAQEHLEQLVDAQPDDPYLRLNLAHVMDIQHRSDAAGKQIDEFKKRWNGDNPKAVWRYLRNLGLGKYVDDDATTSVDQRR